MAPVSIPFLASTRTVVAVVVVSLVLATLLGTKDDVSSTPLPTTIETKGVAGIGVGIGGFPADAVVMMQGVPHIELLGMHDKATLSNPRSEKMHAKDVDDVSLFSGTPVRMSKAKTPTKAKPTDVSLVHMSGGQGVSSQASVVIGAWSSSVHSALMHMVRQRFTQVGTVSSTGGLAIGLLVVLIGCTCIAAMTIVYPEKFYLGNENRRKNAEEPAPATVLEQRESMLVHKSPRTGDAAMWTSPGARFQQQRPEAAPGMAPEPFLRSLASPFASALMPSPMMSSNQVPVAPNAEMAPEVQDAPRPPPLCPTLVMPVCEARFGVPMYELAQLSVEGELNIVGLSGNPLLRAVVRKIGNARTLEISMPEQNSAPRATISPSTMELAGHGQQGSRALEIRGMRGSFYGLLEMRNSGACFVIKDGQTVLTIDGDAESLQLSIKSSVGLQLASVRCSAEPFGGVDHVEIRVEPGVDTVLVLAVVLAVLLLSPYLPPSEQ